MVHIKQTKNSDLTSTEVQKLLKQLADERFSEVSNQSSNVNPVDKSRKSKVKMKTINMLVLGKCEWKWKSKSCLNISVIMSTG